MALIKCKECEKEISDTASVCPNCGFKSQKKNDNYNYTWVKVVSICFPIIGLIIYAVNVKKDERLAKIALKWSLIPFVVWILAIIIFVIVSNHADNYFTTPINQTNNSNEKSKVNTADLGISYSGLQSSSSKVKISNKQVTFKGITTPENEYVYYAINLSNTGSNKLTIDTPSFNTYKCTSGDCNIKVNIYYQDTKLLLGSKIELAPKENKNIIVEIKSNIAINEQIIFTVDNPSFKLK